MHGTIVVYDTVEDCMEAVNKGEADYYYGNNYSVQYYLSSKNYKNLLTITQPDEWGLKICVGVCDSQNTPLISIINQAVSSIPEEELQNILYTNAFQPDDMTLKDYLANNPVVILRIIAVVLILIIIILICYVLNRRKYNRQMSVENKRYEQLSELSNEYFFEYDILKDRLLLPEKSAKVLKAARVTENFTKRLDEVSEKIENADSLKEIIKKREDGSCEIRLGYLDGDPRWLRIYAKVTVSSDGRPIYMQGKMADIQQEKQTQEELIKKASLDSLTGIYNAAASRSKIIEYIQAMQLNEKGGLLIMDVDRFKDVNDRYGHYIGDQLLKKVAGLLRANFRENDIVGRLGGDEFVVFMKNVREKSEVVEKARGLVEKARDVDIDGVHVTLSVGGTMVRPMDSFDTSYIEADQALYFVKSQGRDNVHII